MKRHKVEKEFEYKGYKCVVVLHWYGHRCGYVLLPKNHPLIGKDFFNEYIENIECHGGIAYSGLFYLDRNSYAIGFDCAHYGDRRDYGAALKYFPEKRDEILCVIENEKYYLDEEVRSVNYVVNECKHIVDQIDNIAVVETD